MSWDFYMEADLGGEEPLDLGFEANYTCNVAPMFYDAIGKDGIRAIDGLKGVDALPILVKAIKKMEKEPDFYRKMNPENGWGRYDGAFGALALLRELLGWCKSAPQATIKVV